ncbi:Uncharacterised protein [Mycobacteroides abscessus subsp. abscessus]|nr:Uncharacterised protein [Mycobacteroides abscessus subsp. abscessus]
MHHRPVGRDVGGCEELLLHLERRRAVHRAAGGECFGIHCSLPPLGDELLGDEVLVVDHRAEPADQLVAVGVVGELLE